MPFSVLGAQSFRRDWPHEVARFAAAHESVPISGRVDPVDA